jgi:glycosyltransferase involved in cell wall biosynthesis
LLVPPSDTTALSAALDRLKTHAGERAVMAAAGAEWVRARYGLERMVEAYTRLYEECMDTGDGRVPARDAEGAAR